MPQAFLYKQKLVEWDQMIDVNIKGVLYAIATVLPTMRERQSGHVINLSSVVGHHIYPGGTVYCATNIRVTNISPRAVNSELLATTSDTDMRAGLDEFYQVAIDATNIAKTIAFAIEQPAEVGINEIIVRPTVQVG